MASAQRLGRAVGVLLVVVLSTFAAAWLAAPVVDAAGTDLTAGGADPATVVASAVTVVAAAALVLVACWVATATTWCVVSALWSGESRPAARAHPFLTPLLVRALVGAALGTTALAGPAAATPSGSTAPHPEVPTSGAPTSGGSTSQSTHARKVSLPRALAGLPLPDRPAGVAPALDSAPEPAPEPARQPAAEPQPASNARSVHTVAPGESLWTIAADHLPPGTPPAVVDRWWRAVYDANRPGIGADPDLIRPGTVLRLPRPLA